MVLVPGWSRGHPGLRFSSSCEFPKCSCWGVLVGATPLHLLSQTALPLKSPTGAFIASLRFANAVPPQTLPGTCTTNWNLSGQGPSICSRRPFGHLKAPLGFHCFANANFTYLDNGNVNFPDNKKYSRSKPTIIRIPPTTLMPIRLTLLFFIILFAKTNSSAPTTIIKTDINGYMSFLLSNSDLLSRVYHTANRKATPIPSKQ